MSAAIGAAHVTRLISVLMGSEDEVTNYRRKENVMGTNYYAVRNKPTVESPHHIGKSSAGWLFNFQEQGEEFF